MSWLHANGPLNAHPQSYYAAITAPLPQFDVLTGHVGTELCVVGGGITGLSAALHAAQAGMDVIVLEAARFGWGASGRNGGQVGSGFNWDQMKLSAKLGEATAQALWAQAEEAKALTRDLMQAFAPAADFRPGIIHGVSHTRDLDATADHVTEMVARYDAPVTLLNATQMTARLGTSAFAGGVLDTSEGFCNPLAYVAGLVEACVAAGVRLFERSEVHHIGPGIVRTNAGAVRTRFVFHATNGLSPHLSRGAAARVLPINNYIAVTAPLGAAAPMPKPVAVADDRFVVNYFWQSADGRLVYGGGESYGKRYPQDIAARVRANLARIYPELAGAKLDYAWGGTLAVTATRLPYVADQGNGVFAAGGYSGHGLALAGLVGKAVAEAVNGDDARLQLLAQLPTPALPGGRMFGGAMTTAGMMLAAARDRLGV